MVNYILKNTIFLFYIVGIIASISYYEIEIYKKVEE